jgi:exodeoxyribonuclease VII large subunit
LFDRFYSLWKVVMEDVVKMETVSTPILTVGQFTEMLKETLSEHFSHVWISGEISELSRPASGHVYLTLKDDAAQLKAVLWRNTAARLPFELREGQQVVCCGSIDIYPPRGSYQLILRSIEPQGLGALQLAFMQLKEKLTKEGLFDVRRKKALPQFPRHIAFVTSPSGAAIRDFLQIATRRWRGLQLTIIPAKVQGEGAADDIARGIATAHRLSPRPDILVVGRGGGSVEDLWCFNEEAVVRAVAASEIPTVSAVGHEIDVTLCDLAADVRALTPSEAAERLIPAAEDIKQTLLSWQLRLRQALQSQAKLAREKLMQLENRRVFRRPFERVLAIRQQLDEWQLRLPRSLARKLKAVRERLAHAASRLAGLSPLAVLARGYSVTQRTEGGEIIRDASQLMLGDFIQTRLAKGSVISLVEIIHQEEP